MNNNTIRTQEKIKPLTIIIACILCLLFLRTFILDIMQVQGNSMEPSLQSGSIIIVNRLSYGIILPFMNAYLMVWGKPEKGDIVVFNDFENKKLTVKRCAAVGNDQFHIKGSFLIVNHNNIRLKVGSCLKLRHYKRVPKDHILVLGDNLDNSIDSRVFGFIPLNKVLGKVVKL